MSNNHFKWSGPAWNAYKYTCQPPMTPSGPVSGPVSGPPMAPGAQGGVNVNVKQVCGCCDSHRCSSHGSSRR